MGGRGAIQSIAISIHSPHTGRDLPPLVAHSRDSSFQSTLPTRGETVSTYLPNTSALFQSTLPTRGETRPRPRPPRATPFQSTLPTRGETLSPGCSQRHSQISIHSPHTGRDPSRRCTGHSQTHFNPLSPHGERLAPMDIAQGSRLISIHSPHTGRDHPVPAFLHDGLISIHSPHTGRDEKPLQKVYRALYFNPLSPHGERPAPAASAPSAGPISIHSPRMGRDHPL